MKASWLWCVAVLATGCTVPPALPTQPSAVPVASATPSTWRMEVVPITGAARAAVNLYTPGEADVVCHSSQGTVSPSRMRWSGYQSIRLDAAPVPGVEVVCASADATQRAVVDLSAYELLISHIYDDNTAEGGAMTRIVTLVTARIPSLRAHPQVIEWGDGASTVHQGYPAQAPTFSHRYATPGRYRVVIRLSWDGGARAVAIQVQHACLRHPGGEVCTASWWLE